MQQQLSDWLATAAQSAEKKTVDKQRHQTDNRINISLTFTHVAFE